MNKISENQGRSGSSQIRKGAALSYVGILIKIVAGLLYTPWMVEKIGQNDYGLYTLATSLISIFLLDFGLSTAISRFVSQYNAAGDQKSVNNLLGITYKLFFFIDIIIFITLIVVYLFLDVIYIELTPIQLSRFRVVYIVIATFSVISFPFTTLNGVLISYEKFVELKLCDLFQKISTDLLIILALLFNYGLYALVTVNAITGLITILIKFIIVKRKTPIKINLKFNSKTILNDIFSFSIWSTIVSIAQRFIFNLIPTILGVVSGAVSISIFGISSILEGYLFNITNALNGLFLPKISRIALNDEPNENLLQLMIKVGRIQLIIIGLIIIGFISIGMDFIILWMGRDYMMAYYCTILLMLPSIVYLTQQIADTAIVAYDKVKLQAIVFIIMAIINFGLSIPLSQLWGAVGASLAVCISYFARCIGLNIIYYKSLNLDIYKFFKECHIQLAKPILITMFIGLLVNNVFTDINWFTFMIKGIIIVVSYFTLMWFKGFNDYEKSLVKDTYSNIIKKFKY